VGKSMFKVAIVRHGQEESWRRHWTRGEVKGGADTAPEGLGRTEVVEASSAEEAVAAVQRMHPDCTVMLAGGDEG
jgi:CheY-like chemotaxis protein